ncbi:MAG: hypothetical protein AB7P17_06525 [Nitrospirales bacterium]|nr:hypothetical protein [Nitrospirales bacterium]
MDLKETGFAGVKYSGDLKFGSLKADGRENTFQEPSHEWSLLQTPNQSIWSRPLDQIAYRAHLDDL